jgi:sec-independent protein translocase protein TatC
MATLFGSSEKDAESGERPGGQMSFLDHLDELRSRLIRSVIFVLVVFTGVWFVSDHIYNFLAVPVQRALRKEQQTQVRLEGLKNNETILPLSSLKEGDLGRFVFPEETRIGGSLISPGTSVLAKVAKVAPDQLGLFTEETLYVGNQVIPKGIRLPLDFRAKPEEKPGRDDKLIVTSAMEPFSLYVKVSLYTAISLAVPFLLWQIWAFVAPGLYPHERGYVTPFIGLSTISFVLGAAFAYYILFPPAASYLLGLGSDFRLLLKADDYFDFIILVMLAMGVVFQMPAVTYVLSRIGIVTAGFLLRVWKTALIVILISAAVLSPTSDIPNMLLFAAPMVVLYLISVFIAWVFGRKRVKPVTSDS